MDKKKLKTAKEIIRAYCLDCCLNSREEVRLCEAETCLLWSRRFGKKRVSSDGITTVKAIRLRCLDCKGFSYIEVEKCKEKECFLWEWRFGRKPSRLVSAKKRQAGKRLGLHCQNQILAKRSIAEQPKLY